MPKPTKPSAPSSTALASGSEDVALICGKTDDGKGLHVLRKRASRLEAGIVQPLEEGKPIHGELVTLRPRGETPLCDVEVHYSNPSKPAEGRSDGENRGHPAQVASDTYRKNWDTIWKATGSKKALLN